MGFSRDLKRLCFSDSLQAREARLEACFERVEDLDEDIDGKDTVLHGDFWQRDLLLIGRCVVGARAILGI